MNQIKMYPIGIIHSPYKKSKDIPIQGRFKDDVEAWVELKDEYVRGLKDLDKFSHAILLFYPHRPNHIGLSVVKIKHIRENKLYFTQVDMIDGTPLIDIKPYVKYFDSRENVVSGWLDKHFKNGKIPDKTIIE